MFQDHTNLFCWEEQLFGACGVSSRVRLPALPEVSETASSFFSTRLLSHHSYTAEWGYDSLSTLRFRCGIQYLCSSQ